MSHVTAWFPVSRTNVRWLARARTLAAILAITIPFKAALSQEERSRTPAASVSTPSLASYVPRQDLVLYLEFQGLDAHAGAWHKTAAYRLLSETKFGTLLEDMAIQAIDVYQETLSTTIRVKGVDAVEIVKRIARTGFVIAVFGKPQERWRYVLVLRQGDRPEIKIALQSMAASRHGEAEEKAEVRSFEKAGRTLHRVGSGQVCWFEKGELILTGQSEADEILEVIDGRRPSAVDHPLLVELFKAEDGFDPVAAGFLDSGVLVPLSSELVQLGLGGLKRLELRWGFDQDALLGILRAVAPAPRAGALALFDQPTFGIGSLPPIPAKVSGLTVISIDVAKSYDLIDSLIKLVGPRWTAGLSNPVILEQQGVDLRKDLLANLGSKLAFYTQSNTHDESGSAGGLAASRAAGTTFSVQLRDQDRVARAIDPLMKSFGPFMRQRFRFGPRDRLSLIVASLNFRSVAGPHPRYLIDWPPNTLIPPYSLLLRPTVVLAKDQLVLAASDVTVDGALAAGPRWQPVEAFVPIVRRLPAEMVYMRLADPRAATPVLLASLPVLVRQINAEITLKERLAGKAARDVYLRLDPETIPKIDEVNGRLFPSSTTVTVDGQGAVLTHREALPTISSPAVNGAMLAYLLPTIRASLDAARRAQCVNNFKQIALAMHNYHSANNTFPRAASIDESGKPLLSWRVAILPYLGLQDLYNKFNLDEPWDSAHNKALLKTMPPIYSCPNRVKPERFSTTYQVLIGKNAMFEKNQDIGVVDVTDGTSNTFLIVEARNAVPWTKPDDLTFDPAAVASLFGAGSSHPGGFNAAMADGSVRFIRDTIDVKKFRSMITRNLGEVVTTDDF